MNNLHLVFLYDILCYLVNVYIIFSLYHYFSAFFCVCLYDCASATNKYWLGRSFMVIVFLFFCYMYY